MQPLEPAVSLASCRYHSSAARPRAGSHQISPGPPVPAVPKVAWLRRVIAAMPTLFSTGIRSAIFGFHRRPTRSGDIAVIGARASRRLARSRTESANAAAANIHTVCQCLLYFGSCTPKRGSYVRSDISLNRIKRSGGIDACATSSETPGRDKISGHPRNTV